MPVREPVRTQDRNVCLSCRLGRQLPRSQLRAVPRCFFAGQVAPFNHHQLTSTTPA
jgi:hypothetical protein